tara:strand:+ start:7252 stop:7497 length:246 start_codon:yes stop_codon:yes gene_type:complete
MKFDDLCNQIITEDKQLKSFEDGDVLVKIKKDKNGNYLASVQTNDSPKEDYNPIVKDEMDYLKKRAKSENEYSKLYAWMVK